MKTKDINNLIEELENKINYYRDYKRLFYGGCCYSAYLLAKGFEKLGIKYTILMYQNGYNWNTNKFNRICTGDGCGHVAICVVHKHKKMIIGMDENYENRLIRSLDWEGRWMTREYKKANSKDLLYIYRNNDWNERWNTRFNCVLARELKSIFNKYAI